MNNNINVTNRGIEFTIFEEDSKEIVTLEHDSEELVTLEENTGGTNNYEYLTNKPQINNVTLIGNKTSSQLQLQDKMESLSNMDIEELLNNQGG